ncbi:polysaccharide biosynthesis protein [Profundibacter sp.]
MIKESWELFILMMAFGGITIYFFNLPKIKLNAFETRAMLQVGLVAISLSIIAMAVSYILQLSGSRSVPLIFGMLFFVGSVLMRVLGLHVINYLTDRSGDSQRVLIYGGGSAGIQLASALRQSKEARPVAFLDDNSNLHGLMVAGLPVCASSGAGKLIKKYNVGRILVAMPSVQKERQNDIISNLSGLGVEVHILPSYVDMMAGNKITDDLRLVTPDELLGRDKVALDTPEIAKAYAGRVVMVTGAGGSIGSELCRQLVSCNPARIVLFEQGEFQLYSIDQELRPKANRAGIEVAAYLGSVTNGLRVSNVIADEAVEIILHAAAYKHVPLVESNELEGARNNVLGTQIVVEAAAAAGIERFILISTDKAVRPTNVMGATKRMAELVVQDIQTRQPATKFSMVRFGNVLGSSGSVLPLFQNQIEMGGPVTVTHPEVTRYFMTIPEAACLVLLAGAYAKGGDVFVLDMGKPRKIIDIARQLITHSGRRVLDPETGEGDIEIKITGLRPGEKLYEELLIDNESLRRTPHTKILRAEEAKLSQIEVAAMIKEIRAAVEEGDEIRLRQLIATRVEG